MRNHNDRGKKSRRVAPREPRQLETRSTAARLTNVLVAAKGLDTMSLADRLREVRQLAGISARDASALAGLSPSHVALLETGRHRATTDTASALARAFGVSIDWLVDGSGKPPTARAVRTSVEAARGRARAIVG